MFISRLYRLKKSRHILNSSYKLYQKRADKLSPEELSSFKQDMEQLENAIINQDRVLADKLARKLESFNDTHFKKGLFGYIWELAIALLVALVIATVVRQMWFELYEIPTGSMRPTFEEQDHLTVSKLAFGINMPLETRHLYFDPNLVQRTSILIFSGDKLPFIDQQTTYFGLIPYTKRYIKRCIGKPGDSLYFYGGKIYAIDKEGNPILDLLNAPWMESLDHIPFLVFEGRPTAPSANQILFNQMNIPMGRLNISPAGIAGEIFNGKEWIKDDPNALKEPHDEIKTYSDIFGIRNFAMVRLLTKEQVQQQKITDNDELEGELFLEIHHTPNLTNPAPRFYKESGGYGLTLTPFTTVVPLKQEHLDAIMDNMYTARFVVKNGYARRYSLEPSEQGGQVRFADVPDGTYEFYHGKAVSIGWGGVATALAKDHPLYNHAPNNIQKLFNLGIEFNSAYSPRRNSEGRFPSRYAYFRNGDFYLLGAPILKKDDPILIAFNNKETEKEKKSTQEQPYIAFRDNGPPVNENGNFNNTFIKTFGVTLPENRYMVLGDNHAMSSDSRIFGFVPSENLQGAPSLILWPPGERWGFPAQKPYPIFNIPRLIIWGVALCIFLIWYAYHRKRQQRRLFVK